jgi:hypothetical protein
MDCSDQIDLEQPTQFCVKVELGGVTSQNVGAGIVDPGLNRTKSGKRSLDETLAVALPGQIGGEDGCLATQFLARGSGSLGTFPIAVVVNQHASDTGTGKRNRDRLSDSTRRARNDG